MKRNNEGLLLLTNKRKSRKLDLCATWQETGARNFENFRNIQSFGNSGATEACLLAELAAKFKS